MAARLCLIQEKFVVVDACLVVGQGGCRAFNDSQMHSYIWFRTISHPSLPNSEWVGVGMGLMPF